MISITYSPELQVGMPLGALVEKALEAKGQELLPKIADAIDALRAFKPPPPSETIQVSAPVTAGATAAGLPTTISEGAPGDTNKLKGSDLREFPLPIEIPGLTAPKKDKDSVAGGGADTTTATVNKTSGKVAKGKQLESSGAKETTKSLKSNETPTMTGVGAAGSSSLKEVGKGGLQLKEKTAASSATGKFTGAKEGGKPRPEKEEKVSGGNKDADKEVLSEEGKEKVKAIQKPKKHAKVEVARDKQSAGHRDTPEVGKASSRLAPASKEKEKSTETRMESTSGEQKNPSKSTHRETSKTEYGFDDDISESTSNSSKGTEKAQHIDDEVTEPQPGKQQESAPTGSRKRKQLPPMRRSARLASFKDEDEKDEEAEVKPQDERLPRKGKGAAAGTGGSDGDSEVSEPGEEEPQRRVGKRQLERGKGKASARKKPRILSSSSEEERSESEDKEVEASLFSHEDEKCSKRPRTIRKRRLTLDSDSEAPKTKTISRKRARSQAQGDSSASSSAAKGPKGKVTREEQGSKTSMSKSRSQRLTSPVVVTRYDGSTTLLKMGSYSSTTMCQYWDNC